MKKILTTLTIIGLFFTLTSLVVFAQTTNNKGLSITPYSFDFGTLQPQQTKTETIYLTNLTNSPIDISVDTRNFSASGEEGDVTLTKEATSYSLASWINIRPNKITVPANSKLGFNFTITVPENPEPGGHYGAIVFATVPKKDLKSTGALVSQEVGSLIFVQTPGQITENARIASFTTDKSFYEFGPVNFITRITNNSNVHIRPIGQITIKDMLGHTYTTPLQSENVLPQATRKLTSVWDKQILIGEYTATLNLSYGSKNQALSTSTTFTAFPVRWGLIALGILAFIIFINIIIIMVIVRSHKK